MSHRTNPDPTAEIRIGPKTYAEEEGEDTFDWNAFLRNPPEKYSPEHQHAEELANSWVTCACGNQCAVIPRLTAGEVESCFVSTEGAPKDDELRSLGIDFAIDIGDADWEQAKRTLAAIERRSAELIAQLTA